MSHECFLGFSFTNFDPLHFQTKSSNVSLFLMLIFSCSLIGCLLNSHYWIQIWLFMQMQSISQGPDYSYKGTCQPICLHEHIFLETITKNLKSWENVVRLRTISWIETVFFSFFFLIYFSNFILSLSIDQILKLIICFIYGYVVLKNILLIS